MAQEIPVFVINLARRPDRRARMSDHLATRGVEFAFLEACDATATTQDTLASVIRPTGPLGALGDGDRACTVSHAWLWRQFLETSDAPFVCVLEDDAYVGTDLARILENPDWIPNHGHVIKLEKYGNGSSRILLGRELGKTPSGRRIKPLLSRHAGSGAYLMSRAAAADALERCGGIRVPIDHFLFNANVSPFARKFAPLFADPPMATQRAWAYDSDIAKHGKAARPEGLALRWRKLKRGFFEVKRLPLQTAAFLLGRAAIEEIAFAEDPPDPQALGRGP